jgi:hypothetical protein
MTSPILIMGMHRSGTSLVARMLEALGLFLGVDKDANHEARFFRYADEWLLRQSGGAWDYPEPIHLLLADQAVRHLAADYLNGLMTSLYALRYLGWWRFGRWHRPSNLPVLWGWKDPRLTFTLPVWLDLFPQARVIYVVRHGVDVAASLQARQQALVAQSEQKLAGKRPFYLRDWLRKRQGEGFTNSLRCATLAGGFSLWEAYLAEAEQHKAALGSQFMELRYEDFLAHPVPHLQTLVEFIGLGVDIKAIEHVATAVNPHRAYAYRQNPALQAWAEEMQPQLTKWGYKS